MSNIETCMDALSNINTSILYAEADVMYKDIMWSDKVRIIVDLLKEASVIEEFFTTNYTGEVTDIVSDLGYITESTSKDNIFKRIYRGICNFIKRIIDAASDLLTKFKVGKGPVYLSMPLNKFKEDLNALTQPIYIDFILKLTGNLLHTDDNNYEDIYKQLDELNINQMKDTDNKSFEISSEDFMYYRDKIRGSKRKMEDVLNSLRGMYEDLDSDKKFNYDIEGTFTDKYQKLVSKYLEAYLKLFSCFKFKNITKTKTEYFEPDTSNINFITEAVMDKEYKSGVTSRYYSSRIRKIYDFLRHVFITIIDKVSDLLTKFKIKKYIYVEIPITKRDLEDDINTITEGILYRMEWAFTENTWKNGEDGWSEKPERIDLKPLYEKLEGLHINDPNYQDKTSGRKFGVSQSEFMSLRNQLRKLHRVCQDRLKTLIVDKKGFEREAADYYEKHNYRKYDESWISESELQKFIAELSKSTLKLLSSFKFKNATEAGLHESQIQYEIDENERKKKRDQILKDKEKQDRERSEKQERERKEDDIKEAKRTKRDMQERFYNKYNRLDPDKRPDWETYVKDNWKKYLEESLKDADALRKDIDLIGDEYDPDLLKTEDD